MRKRLTVIVAVLVLGIGLTLVGGLEPEVNLAAPAVKGSEGTVEGNVDEAFLARADVVVYLEHVEGTFEPQQVSMDQRNLTFKPHLLPIVVRSTVTFKNSDNVNHNVFTPDGERYNLGTWGQGVEKSQTFTKTGVYAQLCNIHPEMEAYIVVLQNPFFTIVSRKDGGRFTLGGVPEGDYVLKIWGERLKKKQLKTVANVSVGAGQSVRVTLGATAK